MTELATTSGRMRLAATRCRQALDEPGDPPTWWPYLVRQVAEWLPAVADQVDEDRADTISVETQLAATLADLILAEDQR